jgi:hypothetical protein
MVDSVSPLITMIYVIMEDITWFMIILVTTMFAFGVSFFVIGLNQIDFDLSDSDAA